jgi:adenylate cyclase
MQVIVAHEDLQAIATIAARSPTVQSFIDELGLYLSNAPLRVERMFVSLQTLHPAFRARTYLWRNQIPEIRVVEWPHGLKNRPGYYDSPDYHVHTSRAEFRVRNLQQVQGHSCELYGKLRDEGYTDYLMVPLIFLDGTVNTLSIATRLPGGFSEDGLVRFRELVDLFAVVIERYSALETVSITLGTYLGRGASREVMRGRIRAGHGEMIQAGILFADMHGFSCHASCLGPSATVQLLNSYFDCLVAPIEENGGNVLKFIGDAILAYSPTAAGQPDTDPVGAVLAIRERLADLNRARAAGGASPVHHGVGLHFGEVVFGNIGSSERLDFTIIGDAVNVAARCAEETCALGIDYLATEEFVARFGDDRFVSLGRHQLRGIGDRVALFSLASDVGGRSVPSQDRAAHVCAPAARGRAPSSLGSRMVQSPSAGRNAQSS